MVIRGNEKETITIIKRGEILKVNLKDYISEVKPKVSGIIRIPKNDLWYFDMTSKYLTHFNLESCSHVVGENYLLPKIIEHGYYKENGEEKDPVLDFKLCYIGKCVSVKNNVRYDDLDKSDFKYSFENIQNIDELKEKILERYSKSLPDLSPEEILSKGVSITTLEILGINRKI